MTLHPIFPCRLCLPAHAVRRALVLAALSTAAASAWTTLPGPGGMWAPSLATRGSTAYAWGVGIAATEDCGESWSNVDPGLPLWPPLRAFHASESGLWVAAESGIHRRPGTSSSWSPWNEGLPTLSEGWSVDEFVLDGGRAAALLRNRQWNSCIGFVRGIEESSWRHRWSFYGSCPEIAPSRTGWILGRWGDEESGPGYSDGERDVGAGGETARMGTVYMLAAVGDTAVALASSGSFFRSVDGGRSWHWADSVRMYGTTLDHPQLWADGGSIYFANSGGTRLRRTVDGGLTWQAVPTPPGMVFYGAARCKDATILGTSQGLTRSTAAGGWEPLSGRLHRETLLGLASSRGAWVAVDAQVKNGTLALRGAGEASWSRPAVADSFIQDLRESQGTLFALGRAGLWRSRDAGPVWDLVFPEDSFQWGPSLVGFDGASVAMTDGMHLARSSDAGSTWSVTTSSDQEFRAIQPVGVLVFAAKDLEIEDTDPSSIRPGSEGGIHVTRDSGRTWTPTGLVGIGIARIAFGAGALFAATDTGLFASRDTGATWSRSAIAGMPDGGDVVDVVAQGARVAVAWAAFDADQRLSSASVAVSEDSGRTWSARSIGVVMPARVAFGPEGAVAVATYGHGILLWDGVSAASPAVRRSGGPRISVRRTGRAATLRYALDAPGPAHLELFDALGRRRFAFELDAASEGEIALPALAEGAVFGRFSVLGGERVFRVR